MQKLFKRIISTLTAIVVICACVLPVQAKIDGSGALVYKSDNSSTFDPGGATYYMLKKQWKFKWNFIMYI